MGSQRVRCDWPTHTYLLTLLWGGYNYHHQYTHEKDEPQWDVVNWPKPHSWLMSEIGLQASGTRICSPNLCSLLQLLFQQKSQHVTHLLKTFKWVSIFPQVISQRFEHFLKNMYTLASDHLWFHFLLICSSFLTPLTLPSWRSWDTRDPHLSGPLNLLFSLPGFFPKYPGSWSTHFYQILILVSPS